MHPAIHDDDLEPGMPACMVPWYGPAYLVPATITDVIREKRGISLRARDEATGAERVFRRDRGGNWWSGVLLLHIGSRSIEDDDVTGMRLKAGFDGDSFTV